MIKVQSQRGEISISSAVFTSITGAAATNCFGVKGMAYRSMTDGLVHLLRREAMSKGVKVTYNEDGTVSIELHIIVENGVNIATVCRSCFLAACVEDLHAVGSDRFQHRDTGRKSSENSCYKEQKTNKGTCFSHGGKYLRKGNEH